MFITAVLHPGGRGGPVHQHVVHHVPHCNLDHQCTLLIVLIYVNVKWIRLFNDNVIVVSIYELTYVGRWSSRGMEDKEMTNGFIKHKIIVTKPKIIIKAVCVHPWRRVSSICVIVRSKGAGFNGTRLQRYDSYTVRRRFRTGRGNFGKSWFRH